LQDEIQIPKTGEEDRIQIRTQEKQEIPYVGGCRDQRLPQALLKWACGAAVGSPTIRGLELAEISP
jgi:hypothetical protein